MKALALVAHPDDCVIFASAYMDAHPEHEWTIIYLTHWRWHKRGREMTRYWKKRGIKTKYLGFKDHARDLGARALLTWTATEATRVIQRAAKNYDLILTHNEKGEYGHPHHVVVYNAVKDFPVSKVYFSLDKTDLCYLHRIGVEELPRHQNAIRAHAHSGKSYYKEQLK